MATCAMCFDLMQEEIIAKFTWVGKKLGIVGGKNNPETEALPTSNKKDKEASLDELTVEALQKNEVLNKFRTTYFQNMVQRPQKSS